MLTGSGRLVQEIKTKQGPRYILVTTGESFPQEYEGVLSDFIPPEVMLLQVIAVGAVARSAVDIQGYMDAA